MKKTAIFLSQTFSLTLMTTLITGAVWTASGAPKVNPKAPTNNARPSSGASSVAGSPAKAGAQTGVPAGALSVAKPDAAALGREFTPSRFPGVVVRQVPSASPQGSVVGGGERGVVLKNTRPAPVPGGGVMADVDAASYPSQRAVRAKAKAARKKSAPKSARANTAKSHR